MKMNIKLADLERIANLRAPYRKRLREIVHLLDDDRDNSELLREADWIRQIYLQIDRAFLGTDS